MEEAEDKVDYSVRDELPSVITPENSDAYSEDISYLSKQPSNSMCFMASVLTAVFS